MLKELILANRSYRRFYENEPVSEETLRELVDCARLSASAMNLQPLKFIAVCSAEKRAGVFPLLKWAGYLKEWGGPAEGERPAAYLIALHDTRIKTADHLLWCDLGLACQNILLGAVEKGLGGCIVASIGRDRAKAELTLPSHFEVLVAIALGKPRERVVTEPLGAQGDIKYYRDEDDVHHVPKRDLNDIFLGAI